jgi:ligand-binding sensor domain-containing protein
MDRFRREGCNRCYMLTIACLATRVYAFGLDPSLDVSQYAHASWKLSETFGKGEVWAVSQTPEGYLWLGTQFSLRRFDGIRAVEWQPPPGQRLPSTNTRNLMTSRDGTLWIGTATGLASWKSGKLTHYPEFDKADISALLEDHEGVVWVAGKIWPAGTSMPSKLCAISTTHEIHCFASGGFGPHVTAIFEDSRANLWLGTGTGIWRFRPGPPIHYPSPDFVGDSTLFPKRAFLDDGEGGLLITGPLGIRRLKDGKFSPYPLPPGAPLIRYGKLLRDRDGGLWIGTWDTGLLHIHEGRLDVFTATDGLINQSIENLFEDREGNIWACGTDGLDQFREFSVNTVSHRERRRIVDAITDHCY